MAADAPPSYDSIISNAEAQLSHDLNPEKILSLSSNLSAAESKVLAEADVDLFSTISEIDKDAFHRGVANYMKSESAKRRLERNADEATQACKLIDTMFNNLAFKLGEIDGMNLGELKFFPRFKTLQESYRSILRNSIDLAIKMAAYSRRFDERLLRICLNAKIPEATKKSKIDEFIKEGDSFGQEATGIQQAFQSLQTDFGAFTGSFGNWAIGLEKKNQPEIEKLEKEIQQLDLELGELKAKMIKWGVIGGIGTVGVTAGLCAFLGPVGLIAGLIGAGVTIGFLVHWSSQSGALQQAKSDKEKQKKKLVAEQDAIIATRAQLVDLGSNSFEIFKGQVENLNQVWLWAVNDATSVKEKLSEINRDVRDLDDDLLREYLMPVVGGTIGLYTIMATYLERYADGVAKADVPKAS